MEETHEPTMGRVPCGHEDDCVRVFASGLAVAYCSRCERGFDLGPLGVRARTGMLSSRAELPVLAVP